MAGLCGLAPPEQEAHEDAHARTQDGHGEPEAGHAARCVSRFEVTHGPVAHVRVQSLRGCGQRAALDGHKLVVGGREKEVGN